MLVSVQPNRVYPYTALIMSGDTGAYLAYQTRSN